MDKWLIMGSPNIGGLVKGNRKLNAQERSELALERFESVLEKAKEHDARLLVLGNLLSNEKDFGVLRHINKLIGEECTINLASLDQSRSAQTGLDFLADLGRVTVPEKVRHSFKLAGLPWSCALNALNDTQLEQLTGRGMICPSSGGEGYAVYLPDVTEAPTAILSEMVPSNYVGERCTVGVLIDQDGMEPISFEEYEHEFWKTAEPIEDEPACDQGMSDFVRGLSGGMMMDESHEPIENIIRDIEAQSPDVKGALSTLLSDVEASELEAILGGD